MARELPRNHPLKVLAGLMLAENLGDVHDEINLLHDYFGIEHPEGDMLEGWTPDSWDRLDAARAAVEKGEQDG